MLNSATCSITGFALSTSLGNDESIIWDHLLKGNTGVRFVEEYRALRRSNAAIIDHLSDREPADRMGFLIKDTILRALVAADAKPMKGQCRTGVVIGTSFGTAFASDKSIIPRFIDYGDILSITGADNPPMIVSSACSSGSDALAIAAELIHAGEFDRVICGGVDILDKYKMGAHSALGTLSPTTCRPFDEKHDGTVLGEGAAFFILEHIDILKISKSKARAYLLGYASTTDNSGLTAPDETGAGAARAIEQALQRAGVSKEAIGYVNAHGSGTPVNDRMEAAAFNLLFGEHNPLISSTKSAFGHTLGATGAIEAAVTIMALEHHTAPPTHGLETSAHEWECSRLVFSNSHTLKSFDGLGLSVTYGLGGANTALVFSLGRS